MLDVAMYATYGESGRARGEGREGRADRGGEDGGGRPESEQGVILGAC